MVAFTSLLATLALALTASAASIPRDDAVDCPLPGNPAAGLKWYPSTVLDCSGTPSEVNQTFVGPQPPPNPTHPSYVGRCYKRVPYGSVFIDTLRDTCSCKSFLTLLMGSEEWDLGKQHETNE